MGPNGTGKSTLAKVMAEHSDYTVESGEILLDGVNIWRRTRCDCAGGSVFGLPVPIRNSGSEHCQFHPCGAASTFAKGNLSMPWPIIRSSTSTWMP